MNWLRVIVQLVVKAAPSFLAISLPIFLVALLIGDENPLGVQTGILRAAWTLVTMYGVEVGIFLLLDVVGDYVRLLRSHKNGPAKVTAWGNIEVQALILLALFTSCMAGVASYIPNGLLSLSMLVIASAAMVLLAFRMRRTRNRLNAALALLRSKRGAVTEEEIV